MTVSIRRFTTQSILAISIFAALAAAPVEARRGGSLGSRGSHTFTAPRSTRLTPNYVPPVSRTMTDRSIAGSPQYSPSYQPGAFPQQRPGLFRGFGGGLVTGLLAGGLIGHFLGHGSGYGWGGTPGGGLLSILFQIALIGGVLWLVLRLFRSRSTSPSFDSDRAYTPGFSAPQGYAPAAPMIEFAPTASDQSAFERLLGELQDAFSHEDYARLRDITTPEVMSYLAEELSDNATHGRRNDVTRTNLLDGEISESWQETGQDYATVAMRYESIDVMRDRATGAVLAGSAYEPTMTTELWTFVRPSGGWSAWKVSAIQEA
jgi:predicted lipid-binding transport protein (Tim44 family)